MLTSDSLPRTAVLARRLDVPARTGSTNADLVAAVRDDPGGWKHLSVRVTDDQTAGRGRLDRVWTAPPGAALAISVLLRVPRIPVDQRGWIPLIAGAAMTRAVRAALSGGTHTATLKWPNDVLVDGRKISGILCEAVPGVADAIVAGAGVNTAMTEAQLPVGTATSFASIGVPIEADALIADYLVALDEQVTALADGDGAAASGVLAEVEALCDTLGRQITVHLPDGRLLAGRAQRIDPDGRLVVVSGAAEDAVSAGDVVHVR